MRPHPFFGFRGQTGADAGLQQLRHVPRQHPHRLQAFGIFACFARHPSVYAVPILRRHDGHIRNRKILVQAVERRARPATAADSHGSGQACRPDRGRTNKTRGRAARKANRSPRHNRPASRPQGRRPRQASPARRYTRHRKRRNVPVPHISRRRYNPAWPSSRCGRSPSRALGFRASGQPRTRR